jgi:CMP-N-acetylneuraminic acid synthetase
MNFKHRTIAIIPARGGSKGVPKKNIRDLGGFPLLAYSIVAAKLAKNVDRVIVSTDSKEIAAIAKKFGAEVPFLRPAEFATDKAIDKDYIKHALRWFKEHEGGHPDYLVNLRPTTPLRDPKHIDEAIALIKTKPETTSLRSGHEIKESPYKLFGIENDFFTGLFPHDPRPEYYDLTRQSFPPVYQPDGYVDIIVSNFALNSDQLHGPKILAYRSPDTGEVDRLEDFKFIEYNLQKQDWEIYRYLKENF